jgi:hypothetical protein
MTRLILPSGTDPIVTRMIQNIEFLRADDAALPAQIQVFELPVPVEVKPTPIEVDSRPLELDQSQNQVSDDSAEEVKPAHVIDWWAAARKLTQESGEEELKRWMLEQGYERYVSIMQGAFPTSNAIAHGLPVSTQEDATGYLNSYGDLEFKISENCVMQTQVSARFPVTDFDRNLPMRVTCKPPAKVKYSFDRR